MNPEKVVFGFFIVLALTLNFGFFVGELDNPEHHHVYELFAVVVVNLIATIITLRAPGMTMFRMPIFTWMALVVQFLLLFAIPVLTSAQVLLMMDRLFDAFGMEHMSVHAGLIFFFLAAPAFGEKLDDEGERA